MDPVDITEEIVEQINTNFISSQGMLVEAEAALDPQKCLDHDELRCFVVPDIVSYNLNQSKGRKSIVSINSLKFVSVILSTTFKALNKGPDLTTWTEAKKVLKTRYELDAFLLTLIIDGNIVTEIESNLPDEVEQDHRNFVTVTSLGFQVIECGTQPESLLSLQSSRRR
jgi:hypothetical protein